MTPIPSIANPAGTLLDVFQREELETTLLASPEDVATRFIYSYWLRDHDDGLWFVHRWMAARNKRPVERLSNGNNVPVRAEYRWAWWSEGRSGGENCPLHSQLPVCVFKCLLLTSAAYGTRFYPSFEEAVSALAVTLAVLQDALTIEVPI